MKYYLSNLYLILILLNIFLFSSCILDKFDTKLKIINKTNETVFVDILKNENSLVINPIRIDSNTNDTLWNYMRWIPALDSLSNIPPFGSWESFINNECQDSILTLVFYSETKLKTFTNDSIDTKIFYSNKYKLKIQDLEKRNWRILYK